MKKVFILFFIIISCTTEKQYYPSKQFFKEHNPQEINIDTITFEVLFDSLSNQLFKDKRYYIEVKNSNKSYRISPFTYSGGFIKERNALEIFNDSIYVFDEKYPITLLDKYLKVHFDNNGNLDWFSTSPKYAFVKLVFHKNTKSKIIKKRLLEVVNSFDKVFENKQDSYNLSVMFDKFNREQMSIPPPPISIE